MGGVGLRWVGLVVPGMASIKGLIVCDFPGRLCQLFCNEAVHQHVHCGRLRTHLQWAEQGPWIMLICQQKGPTTVRWLGNFC